MQTRRILSCFILLAGLLAGCGGSGDNARTVTIDTVATYWAEDGTKSVGPVDYVAAISIERPGDARSYPATPDASRLRWTVDDVPAGPYYVRLTYTTGSLIIIDVATGASVLDFGIDRSGRAAGESLTKTTPVTLALSGLQPWDPGSDFLESLDWNVRSLFWPRLTAAAGATSGVAAAYDWKGRMRVLPADTLWVTQNRDGPTSCASGGTYQLVVAAQSVTGISMADGVPVTITADRMAPPPGTGSVRLNWKPTQYLALLEPSTSTPLSYALMKAQPAPLSVAGSGLTLASLAPKSIGDVNCANLPYPRFLPTAFQEYISTAVEVTVSRTVPGTATTFQEWPSVLRVDPIGSVPDPLVPLVGPPTGVTVNGMNAAEPIRGVGLTPTIAWQGPLLGSASVYVVDVEEVSAGADGVNRKWIATWIQAGTRLELPPGLLEVGKTYLFGIEAKSDPSGPGMAAPFRQGAGSRGHAAFISQPIQP